MEMVEIPTFAVNETVVGNGEVSVEIAPKADEKAGFYKFVVPEKQ
jgi:hypothetical protein